VDDKKVRKAQEKLSSQVHTPVEEPVEEPIVVLGKKRRDWVPSDRRKKVADLWYKGHLQHDIAKAMGITIKQVSDDLKVVKRLLEPKTIRAIEYYRNRSRHRLDMIRKAAWEMADESEVSSGAKVAALRLVKEVEELTVKVDGVVGEKMTAGPDRKAEELMKELRTIAKGKDNGHKEVEVSEIAPSD